LLVECENSFVCRILLEPRMHLHDMHECKLVFYRTGEALGVKFSHGHARKASNLKSR